MSAPKVVFTEFSLSNQSIPIGSFAGRTILSGPINDSTTVVRFSYQDKGIQFSFTTTDYSQPDKNQFAYRLIGFDTTWHIVGPKQRFANYSSLPGGEYMLEVKASIAMVYGIHLPYFEDYCFSTFLDHLVVPPGNDWCRDHNSTVDDSVFIEPSKNQVSATCHGCRTRNPAFTE